MKRVTIIVAVGSLLVSLIVAAQPAPTGPEARDMALVGFNDLQGRSAYQPVIREQNGRFILYVGRMRSSTSPTHRHRSWSHASDRSEERTRTGGSAIQASRTWCRVRAGGARDA